MPKLAINGGPKVRTSLLPNQQTWGWDEASAAFQVIRKGPLTGYQGNWSEAFYGGPEIRALEKEWCEKFGSRHAICVNSCTSGLFVALGAVLGPLKEVVGLPSPGDPIDQWWANGEVIVSPYSMTCSASLPLAWGARPVFADIERDHFCIDPVDVERKITDRTKAILAVSLFGQPYDPKLNEIAEKHGIPIIEDAAQALGSRITIPHSDPYIDPSAESTVHFAGTLGTIGVYSFNQGKHITCGEGGMIVTDDDELAHRCRLLMNHSESVVHDWIQACKHPESDRIGDYEKRVFDNTANMYGFNLRLGEMAASVLRVQLSKLDEMLKLRLQNVEYLQQEIPKVCPALEALGPRAGASHTYYVLPFRYDTSRRTHMNEDETTYYTAPNRNRFIEAVCAELSPCEGREHEGVPIRGGYITPIYRMPLFDLPEGTCPMCEQVQNEELVLVHRLIGPNADRESLEDVVRAFGKVWENRGEL